MVAKEKFVGISTALSVHADAGPFGRWPTFVSTVKHWLRFEDMIMIWKMHMCFQSKRGYWWANRSESFRSLPLCSPTKFEEGVDYLNFSTFHNVNLLNWFIYER